MKKLLLSLWLSIFATLALAQQVPTPSITALACAYNSATQTGTSGQFMYVQCDSAGRIQTAVTSVPNYLIVGPSPTQTPSPGLLPVVGRVNPTPVLTQLTSDIFTGTGVLSGRTPLIGPGNWSSSGTITVSGGYISAASNAYAFISTGSTPYHVTGVFRNVGAAAASTIAVLLTSANLNDMVHVNYGSTSIAILFWKTAGTTACPLGTSCSPQWQIAPSFTSLSADTDYIAHLTIDVVNGTTEINAWIEDTSGNIIGRANAADPNFAGIIGPNLMYQLGATTSRWSQVSSMPSYAYTTADAGKFNAGINGPIGLTFPAAAIFQNAHIGIGLPAGKLSARLVASGFNGDTPVIFGYNRAADFIVRGDPDTAGFGATVSVGNSAGAFGTMSYDGSFVHCLAKGGSFPTQSSAGSAATCWLSQPNTGAPFFGGGIIALGGQAVTHVALKRSTTTIQARLGDDSAFTNIQGKLTTDNAATTGLVAGALAALTTSSLTITDSTGTVYRVPAITP